MQPWMFDTAPVAWLAMGVVAAAAVLAVLYHIATMVRNAASIREVRQRVEELRRQQQHRRRNATGSHAALPLEEPIIAEPVVDEPIIAEPVAAQAPAAGAPQPAASDATDEQGRRAA